MWQKINKTSQSHSFLRAAAKNASQLLGFAGVLLVLAACDPVIDPIVDQRGHLPEDQWHDEIKVGLTTREQVSEALGSPSTQSSFGDEVWYYISTRKETLAFYEPETTDQQVLRIEFTPQGVVKSADLLTKEQARNIEFSERETPTEGHSMGFFEQMLGNLGRFNRPGSLPGSGGVGTPGRPGR